MNQGQRISANQASLLQTLADAGTAMPLGELRKKCGVSQFAWAQVQSGLRDRGLVDQDERVVVSSKCAKPKIHLAINADGRRALFDHKIRMIKDQMTAQASAKALAERRVAAPTRNFLGTVYQPPKVWCRNNGHAHIPSHGLAC